MVPDQEWTTATGPAAMAAPDRQPDPRRHPHVSVAAGNFQRCQSRPTDADSHDLACPRTCLLYTSDAADERSSVDLGGRRHIKKKKTQEQHLIPTQDASNLKRPTHIRIAETYTTILDTQT